MTRLTPEVWAKIRERNKNLHDTINKIKIEGITAEEYKRKFPKLAQLINLEEALKMKEVVNTQNQVTEVKVKKEKKVIMLPGNIGPKEIAAELKTTPKQLRKVIRRLKLVRTGKQWQWNPKDPHDIKDINLIKASYINKSNEKAMKIIKKKITIKKELGEEVEAEEIVELGELVEPDEGVKVITVAPAM